MSELKTRQLNLGARAPLNLELKASEELDVLCSDCFCVFRGKMFSLRVKELDGNWVLAQVVAPTAQKLALCQECRDKKT